MNRRGGLLLSIALIALAVRAAGLGSHGLWLDEAMQVRASLHPSLGDVLRSVPLDKPPLGYIETHFMSRLGLNEWWLRSLSAFWGVVSVETLAFFARTLSVDDARGSSWVWPVFAAFLVVGIAAVLRDRRRAVLPLLLAVWLVGGIGVLYVSARMQHHWIAARYLVFFVAPFAVLVAGGCVRVASWIPQKSGRTAVLVAAACVLASPGVPFLWRNVDTGYDFRDLAKRLADRVEPGDRVLFQHAYHEYCYDYYRACVFARAPVSTFYQRTTPDDVNPDWESLARGATRLWAPEIVYDSYPVAPEARTFFLGVGGNPSTQDPVPVRCLSSSAFAGPKGVSFPRE
ncbi:hypothetical protein JW916_08785 [Candidatus Sumerlaeota bacterium]|nr:hypothetical protein [Candidatus Sumerlaeota bacterium]